MFIFGYSSPLWLFYDVDACGLFSCGSNVWRQINNGAYPYAEFVGSRHYHWLYPSVVGLDVVGIVIVGNYYAGGYSPQNIYGPAAGLFFNESYLVDGHRVIGSLILVIRTN